MEVNLPLVIELNKSVAIFDYNLTETSISFKELFQVPFPGIARNISNVNSLSTRHFDSKYFGVFQVTFNSAEVTFPNWSPTSFTILSTRKSVLEVKVYFLRLLKSEKFSFLLWSATRWDPWNCLIICKTILLHFIFLACH